MATSCCYVCETLFGFFDKPDPRMNFILMESILVPILTAIAYLFVIFVLGPAFMRHKKAYSLKYVILAYNTLQILANGTLFILLLREFPKLNMKCTPPAPHTPEGLFVVKLHYYYLVLKFTDLIETAFFVLRKKHRQISVLHLYHHIGMIVITWVPTKYFPGGQGTFIYTYNTFVHFIMYCYYFITSLRPGHLWWKRYVTIIQLIQHYLAFSAMFLPLIYNCPHYPKHALLCGCINVAIIIYLFTKFYMDNYVTTQTTNKEKIK